MSFAGVSVVGGDGGPPESASATTPATYSGYHLLVVRGYSSTKDAIPNGEFVGSRRFKVGGYQWRIEYYPNGYKPKHDGDISCFYLVLDQDDIVEHVEVEYGFSLVDGDQKLDSTLLVRARETLEFSSEDAWSLRCDMEAEIFEESKYLMNDSFTVRCDVTITKDVPIGDAAPPVKVVPPPPDIQKHLGSLFLSNEGTDVTFQVGAETFAAHRCVLAARSAVFKAELFGSMKEGTTAGVIRVDDIEPQVFKLLLSFVYSGSVPAMEEEDEDVLWQHLLVAADRYDLRRLRLMSEEKLCGYIGTSTVVAILALAEQHHCAGLKESCLEFLNARANLQVVMASGGLDDLTSSCPTILKEIIAKLASIELDATTGEKGAAALSSVAVPPSDIRLHFSRQLQSGEGADVTFQVGNETLMAHRCVLAARSTVFRAPLFSHEEGMASSSVIRIDSVEPKVIELLLSFIYSDEMPAIEEEGEEAREDNDDTDVMWQHLLMAADKYELERLKLLCEEKLCGYINVSTVATILALAEQLHCQGLKEACLDFLDSPTNLHDVMATGRLEYLRNNCSSVLIDLIAKLASIQLDN